MYFGPIRDAESKTPSKKAAVFLHPVHYRIKIVPRANNTAYMYK